MLSLLVNVSLFRYFGDGPEWPAGGTDRDQCKESWWWNLLYINNFEVKKGVGAVSFFILLAKILEIDTPKINKQLTGKHNQVRKPISVTPRKIYYTKGVILQMKGVKTHLKAK